MDIRGAYEALIKPLNQINTVASFAISGATQTLVTVTTPNLSFFGTNYVIFDSYTYYDIYQVIGVDDTQFIIDTPFVGDDAGVNIYDVTEVYSYVITALNYIASLPCADPLDPSYMDAVYYYALYLYSQASPQQLKRTVVEGQKEVEFFQGGSGQKSNYFAIADQFLDGCLTASLTKKITPTIRTTKAWRC